MFNETLDTLAEHCIDKVNAAFKTPEYGLRCRDERKDIDNRVVGFAWSVRYNKCVSNTHSAPKGKKTNWGVRDKTYPTGFPGFDGRVWIRYEKYPVSFFSSDVFNKTCFHTGTGGGGNYSLSEWEQITKALLKKNRKLYDELWHPYSWDFRFYIEDFPELEKMVAWELLRGTDPFSMIHEYIWNDEDQINWVRKQCYDDSVLV